MSSMDQFSLQKRDINLEIKIDQYNDYLNRIYFRLNNTATMQQIVDGELAKILEVSYRKTDIANEAKIRKRVAGMRAITLAPGKVQGLYNKKNGKWQKFPAKLWNEIESVRAKILTKKLGAIGTSRHSWYALANACGIQTKINPTKSFVGVRSQKGNVFAIKSNQNTAAYTIEIRNLAKLLRFTPPGGLTAFFSAMAGRIGYYERNMLKGVFDDASAIAKKYKGIVVTKQG